MSTHLKNTLGFLIFSILVLSCSPRKDSLLGEWTDEKTETEFFIVGKFGEQVVMISEEKQFPIYVNDDNNFYLNMSGLNLPLTYDSNEGKLLFNGYSYIKFDNSHRGPLVGNYTIYNADNPDKEGNESLRIFRKNEGGVYLDFSSKKRKDGELYYSSVYNGGALTPMLARILTP